MSQVAPVTAALPPVQPATPPQTPQSQYLAAALKQLSANAPATPAALGMNLASEAMLRSAQQRQGQSGLAAQLKPILPLGRASTGLLGLGLGAPPNPMLGNGNG